MNNQKRPISLMASYKDPTLQERTALAKAARDKALAKLAAKPKIDEAVLAERIAAAAAFALKRPPNRLFESERAPFGRVADD